MSAPESQQGAAEPRLPPSRWLLIAGVSILILGISGAVFAWHSLAISDPSLVVVPEDYSGRSGSFPDGYDEDAFDSIEAGMTIAEVEAMPGMAAFLQIDRQPWDFYYFCGTDDPLWQVETSTRTVVVFPDVECEYWHLAFRDWPEPEFHMRRIEFADGRVFRKYKILGREAARARLEYGRPKSFGPPPRQQQVTPLPMGLMTGQ